MYNYPLQQPAPDEASNLSKASEFIKDKLYFVSLSQPPQYYENVHFFTIDNMFVYINFYSDFGPSNISHVVKFCEHLQLMLYNPAYANMTLCMYSSFDIDKRCNALFLLCAFMMLVYKKVPEDACAPLAHISPPLPPYRDAGYGPATYHLTILDCIRGMYKAICTGLFDFEKFDREEYDFYEKVENGDYNWITNKFLALANPKDAQLTLGQPQVIAPTTYTKNGKPMFSCYRIDNLVKWMLQNNIKTIIRLNNRTYDKRPFLEAGIEHIELFFPDGSIPPDEILFRFLEICETRVGPIAIHCKAGLGRTGSLIAAYLMKHYRLTASEVISFMRVIRPGSVVGPQQNYLQSIQGKLWKLTPSERLPPAISCWSRESSLSAIVRFGRPNYATELPKLPSDSLRNEKDVESELADAKKEEIYNVHNMYGQVKEYEQELARERTHMSKQAIQELSIPCQPRKYINGTNTVKISKGSGSIIHQHQLVLKEEPSANRYHLRSFSASQALGNSYNPYSRHRKYSGMEQTPEVIDLDPKITEAIDMMANRRNSKLAK